MEAYGRVFEQEGQHGRLSGQVLRKQGSDVQGQGVPGGRKVRTKPQKGRPSVLSSTGRACVQLTAPVPRRGACFLTGM